MAFSHPTRHLPKMNTELLILMLVILLVLMALLTINLLNRFPEERAVPQPTIANPGIPIKFSKLQGSQSITEVTYRTKPQSQEASPLRSAIVQLLKGPNSSEKSKGYYSEIPKGTELLGLTLNNGTLQINLSKEFTAGGGSTSIIQRVNELKGTVYSLEGKRKIEVVVEGKPLQTLGGEGLEI